MTRIIQLYAGTDPKLNRREYAQQRLFERILQGMLSIDSIDRMTAGEILRQVEAKDVTLSPTEKRLILNNVTDTYKFGLTDAVRTIPKQRPPPVDVLFRSPSGKAVNTLTDYVVDGLQRLGGDAKTRIADTLLEGYDKGETIPKLSSRIESVLGITSRSATRMARTTTNEVYNQAHMETYVEYDVPGVQYVAADDELTCPYCGALHGHIWALDDPGIVHPTTHFHCRCRLIAWMTKLPRARKVDEKIMSFYTGYRAQYMPIPILATA